MNERTVWLYLDPSAWVKRYVAEQGSAIVDSLWEQILQGRGRGFCNWLGFIELVGVLQRWRNRHEMTGEAFLRVYRQFQQDCEQVEWRPLTWERIQASVAYIARHNLNATDALHLQVAIEQAHSGVGMVWVVTSDRRLARASLAEGLNCFDPEREPLSSVASVFSSEP